MTTLNINGQTYQVDVPTDTPLLWVLRDILFLTGTKYGCGIAVCWACTVHVNGVAEKSCDYTVGAAAGKAITTIEGLSPDGTHPLQRAWIAEQAPQCGYLPVGDDYAGCGALAGKAAPIRWRHQWRDEKRVRLRHVSARQSRDQTRGERRLNRGTHERFHHHQSQRLDRREFLKVTGGLLLAFTLEGGGSRAMAQGTGATGVTAYIRIGADETITILVGGGEMGQGIYTGLSMAAAEELMVKWEKVKVEPLTAISSWLSAGSGASACGSPLSSKPARLRARCW